MTEKLVDIFAAPSFFNKSDAKKHNVNDSFPTLLQIADYAFSHNMGVASITATHDAKRKDPRHKEYVYEQITSLGDDMRFTSYLDRGFVIADDKSGCPPVILLFNQHIRPVDVPYDLNVLFVPIDANLIGLSLKETIKAAREASDGRALVGVYKVFNEKARFRSAWETVKLCEFGEIDFVQSYIGQFSPNVNRAIGLFSWVVAKPNHIPRVTVSGAKRLRDYGKSGIIVDIPDNFNPDHFPTTLKAKLLKREYEHLKVNLGNKAREYASEMLERAIKAHHPPYPTRSQK